MSNDEYRLEFGRLRDWRTGWHERHKVIVTEYITLRDDVKGNAARKEKGRAALDDRYRPLADLLAEEWKQIEAAEGSLKEHAVGVTPAPEGWHLLMDSWDGEFSSQTQASHYARHRLSPEEEFLKALGFRVEVTRSKHGWELRADCPPWQFDALRRRMSLAHSLAVWRQHAVNERVYCPLLPY